MYLAAYRKIHWNWVGLPLSLKQKIELVKYVYVLYTKLCKIRKKYSNCQFQIVLIVYKRKLYIYDYKGFNSEKNTRSIGPTAKVDRKANVQRGSINYT